MPAIHVREIDDAVLEILKARAARHHRSLQGEIRQILEEAAGLSSDSTRRRRKLRLRTVAVGGPVYSRETIYD